MDSFENLQKNWLSQPVDNAAPAADTKQAWGKWQKQQRRVLMSNIGVTLSFVATLAYIGYIYFAYRHEFGWPFGASIAAIYCLLVVYLFVVWRSYGFKKESFENTSTYFIKYQLAKLAWQRKVLTTYVWVYMVFLWLALCLYIPEVTKTGSLLYTMTAIGITTLFIAAVAVWNRYYKNRKQIQEVDEMMAELQQILAEIVG